MANGTLSGDSFLETVPDHSPGRMRDIADHLQGLAQNQQRMLDAIDGLRSATLDEVKLPQLVVVGDQSAGKSSVLEAISGIPMPKDSKACTRLATEFRLRRGAEFAISVGIIPSKDRIADDRDRLSQLTYRTTDPSRLGSIINQAEDAIFGGTRVRRFASRDVLTVKISGPTMPLLTLIDLPGFIHTSTREQAADDIEAINQIASDYMKRPRTIILAVVAGNTDYATQVVLKKARDCDTRGLRTLGIVTKPDVSRTIGLEDTFLNLVRNKEFVFDLGWHVLRNRSHEEMDLPAEVRNQNELEFFSQGKWGTLPSGTYGVKDLVSKLSELLSDNITEYFPDLLKEIKEELMRSEEELSGMGRRVDTESEMMMEVVTLFSRSRDLMKSGIQGSDFDRQAFFHMADKDGSSPVSARNFRAYIWHENTAFEEDIRERGCEVPLVAFGGSQDSDSGAIATLRKFETGTVKPFLETYRGQQLQGDYDPLLVYHLFAEYSRKWDDIARDYSDRMEGIASKFLQQVVDSVWPQRMRTRLWSMLLNERIQERHERAKEELARLLRDRLRRSPFYGPEYPKRLKELRERFPPLGESSSEREFSLKMIAYYELTSKIFISNVITQVAERHLIDGLDTVFDMVELLQMDSSTVAEIAAEDKLNRTKRDGLERKVAGLKKAHNDCQAIAMASGQKTERADQEPLPEQKPEQKHDQHDTTPHKAMTNGATVAPLRKKATKKAKEIEPMNNGQRQLTQGSKTGAKAATERAIGVSNQRGWQIWPNGYAKMAESVGKDSDDDVNHAAAVFSDDEDLIF